MKTYNIFNVNAPLLAANEKVQGSSPINAVKSYLKEKGIKATPKRSGSNYVQISAQEIYYRDGKWYYANKPQQWYELVN